ISTCPSCAASSKPAATICSRPPASTATSSGRPDSISGFGKRPCSGKREETRDPKARRDALEFAEPPDRPQRRDALPYTLPLLPTSLVGSYAQPEWLIDRNKLAGRFPPRVRARELWRVDPEWLDQAQDDATLLAIRDQE